MNFEKSIKEGHVKKIGVNNLRAKSLIKSSREAIKSALSIRLEEGKLKTIFRELYEGLREFCDAIGHLKGYKFLSHEAITYFLSEILNENSIAVKFDRLRKIRNGISYYGESVAKETVEEALKEVPEIIKKLEKYAGGFARKTNDRKI